MSADAQELRNEFDTAKNRALKVSLDSAVSVGRWPLLGRGDYRIVLVERGEALAEVFFFVPDENRFDMPNAVAVAHFRKGLPRATAPVVTVRKIDEMNGLDSIRIDDVLLTFD